MVERETAPAEAPDFWEWLKAQITASGLPIQGTSLALGFHLEYLGQVLRKRSCPPLIRIERIGEYYGAPGSWVATWRNRIITRFGTKRGYLSEKRLHPRCRDCGRKAGLPGKLLVSYDPESNSYQCTICRSKECRRKVRCRRCLKVVDLTPCQLDHLESLKDGPEGLTYFCRECRASDFLPQASIRFLAERADLGARPSPGEIAAIRAEDLNAAIKRIGGRKEVDRRRSAARKRTQSERGRRRRLINRTISSLRISRSGSFHLCRFCRKLIYVRADRLGVHGSCFRSHLRTEEYRQWRRNLGDTRSPLFALRLRRYPRPLPARPLGRGRSSDELRERLCWLLQRFLLRKSPGKIAAAGGFERSIVLKGINSLIALLPETWAEVFPGSPVGRRLDIMLPMERLRRELPTQ